MSGSNYDSLKGNPVRVRDDPAAMRTLSACPSVLLSAEMSDWERARYRALSLLDFIRHEGDQHDCGVSVDDGVTLSH